VTSSRPRRPARAIRWFYLLFGCAVSEFRFIARPVGEMCRSLVSVRDLSVCSKQVLIFLFFLSVQFGFNRWESIKVFINGRLGRLDLKTYLYTAQMSLDV